MKQTTFCAILLLATGCTSPKKTHTADPLRVGSIVVTPSSDIDAALYGMAYSGMVTSKADAAKLSKEV